MKMRSLQTLLVFIFISGSLQNPESNRVTAVVVRKDAGAAAFHDSHQQLYERAASSEPEAKSWPEPEAQTEMEIISELPACLYLGSSVSCFSASSC